MKKINFKEDVLPHLLAVLVFLVVTIIFFNPVFFDNKALSQGDIQQWEASSKALRDYRASTGEEGLWAPAMFGGMPAYLINMDWSNGVIVAIKRIFSIGLPHPVVNIYWAFLSYYILLLAFRVRPMLAIAGALAFGLSSYMIVGLAAGHNARVGAIAFMPLVMAGIHMAFSSRRLMGFVVTALGLSLHFRENHLQITYYMLLIVVVYGIVHLVTAFREKKISDFLKNIASLLPAVALAVATFLGPMWAIAEYGEFSIRGKSELASPGQGSGGLDRDYAFFHSSGMLESLTLMIPNVYGGSSADYLVQDEESNTYQALMRSGDNNTANQLARFSSAYWGPQVYTAPYYGGAIICFLFVIGIVFADKKHVWWLVVVSLLGAMISWGRHFEVLNYFLFDYLPGFNKFRSVTFAIVITLFAMPLLGMLGLEKLFEEGLNPATKKKLLIAFAFTGGVCLLAALSAGLAGFLREGESQLPAWFTNALREDRKALFRSDAIRSFSFILGVFILLYLDVPKKISSFGFHALLIFLVTIDMSVVDKRYFDSSNYQRKRTAHFTPTAADEEVLKDKGHYRVYSLQESFGQEARTAYFHNSLGGYHGAKIRRYQDLYDSCLSKETDEFIEDAQKGSLDFEKYGTLNMLNAKYVVFGPDKTNIIDNPAANGNAWFVSQLVNVSSPAEELAKVCDINTRIAAVIDNSKFQVENFGYDSAARIELLEMEPPYLKYESESSSNGLAVFSEIYYPRGWKATIDGNEAKILRVDYVLRALEIPAGKHVIEFRFEPSAYEVGDKVVLASSWLLLLVLLGSLGWSIKNYK